MEEKRFGNRYNLGFLFKKSNIDKRALRYILAVPEYVDAIEKKICDKYEISDDDLLNTLKEVYQKMREELHTDGFKQQYKEKYGTQAYHDRSSRYRTVKKWCRYLT